MKVLLPMLLVMALLTATMPAFAATSSPQTKIIGNVKIFSRWYDGTEKQPTVRVWDTDGNLVPAEGFDVKVNGTPINAGRYMVTITGKGQYTGAVTAVYKILKAYNPFKIKAGKTTFTYKKNKAQSTSISVSGLKENAKLGRWMSTSSKVRVIGNKLYIAKGFKGTAYISRKAGATANYRTTRKNLKISVTAK
jgi:hypothetical protein